MWQKWPPATATALLLRKRAPARQARQRQAQAVQHQLLPRPQELRLPQPVMANVSQPHLLLVNSPLSILLTPRKLPELAQGGVLLGKMCKKQLTKALRLQHQTQESVPQSPRLPANSPVMIAACWTAMVGP